MLTFDELHSAQCQPKVAAMRPEEIAQQLTALPTWALKNGAIERTFKFANFFETITFINALANVAHRQDHHPDLQATYSTCVLRFATHSAAGITSNDFICAAQIEALYSALFTPQQP